MYETLKWNDFPPKILKYSKGSCERKKPFVFKSDWKISDTNSDYAHQLLLFG